MRFPDPLRFAASMWRWLGWVLRGRTPFVSPPVFRARLNRCKRCRQFDYVFNQCNACTCYVPGKAMLPTETCPLGFWHPVRLTFSRFHSLIKRICLSLIRPA